MSEKMAVVTFNDLDKAEAVQKRLEQAGIPADVYDESKLQRFWFLSKPLAGEKVCVAEKDFEKARQILEQADATEHILQGEVRCPQCGSPRIEYPQFTRKFITTTLVEVFCFLHVIDKEFYCTNCHYMWPTQVEVPPKTDVLNWPVKEPHSKPKT